MRVLTFFLLLAVPCAFARLPLFFSVFGIFLALPVLFFMAANPEIDPQPVYYGLLGAALALVLVVGVYRRRRGVDFDLAWECEPLVLFGAGFALFHALCLRWPDFFSIGERLRDYALLSSAISSPVLLREPWFAGTELNYYGYWYRMGNLLHELLGLETWEVYHQLQSITFSLFLTCSYVLFREHLRLSRAAALFPALFITFGSNIAGVEYLFIHNQTWWYPSRVIPGAIHEFPIWSFVLGDLHPHFLNLGLIPFFVLSILRLAKSAGEPADAFLLMAAAVIIPCLSLFASNAWEMPLWVGLICAACVTMLPIVPLKRIVSAPVRKALAHSLLAGMLKPRRIALLAVIAFAAYALHAMSRNIVPIDSPLRFVGGTILRSALPDFMRHWGFPLFLITAANVVLLDRQKLIAFFFMLLFSVLFFRDVLPFLLLLWAVNIYRMVGVMRDSAEGNSPWSMLSVFLFELLGVAGLTFIIVPEVVFLDDPYGGENERMNTIFKVYSGSWFILHAFAFYLAVRTCRMMTGQLPRGALSGAAACLTLLVFSAFFFVAAKERVSNEGFTLPRARGLTRLETMFPGAAETIRVLDTMDDGIVLEGQGRPYSETTHVATLAHKPAYLGWSNHVHLLYRARGEEIARRERITRELYTSGDCRRKQSILREESIAYAVVGPLEKQQYPEIAEEHFACLRRLIDAGEYRVYGP